MSVRRADDNTYTLLSNASASGAATTILGGKYIFMVEGTVGGATITLQVQSPNGTFETVLVYDNSAVSTTTLPYALTGIDLPAGAVKAVVSGGAPSALYGYLVGLG